MTAEYHRLGDYIREVNVRNKELKVTRLLGLSIEKKFIPSIANIIGTDMAGYKIVHRRQFAYVSVTSRNGEKITVALLEDCDEAIISQAYTVFEVVDCEKLLPEYLMMWFRRPEFDRYARFHSHGSAREVFDWDELCDVQLPVPSIERQREIVSEYETLTRRIRLNNQMIEKLEATAQALYRHTFVDNIDKQKLPDGWRMGTLGEVATCLDYKRKPLSEDERKPIKGRYPYYGAMSVVDHINQYLFDGTYLLFSEDGANVIDEKGHPALQYLWGKFWVNNHAHVLQGNEVVSTEYLYIALKDVNAAHLVTGAAQPKINQENMNSIQLVVPSKEDMEEFNKIIQHVFQLYKQKTEENTKLAELQSLLLAKMGNNKIN